ncbi:hypothetical protein CSUB01_11615 [Colletotrichum sublineola]|uniref:Uncharacterized protein n=1 Tax=Colletotrichum sublineola TaxID=1173701 RepID=A0A066XCV6_COLSU|nr:hypothetical protein CSUB01_11615 [Colletotrichum sublineola]
MSENEFVDCNTDACTDRDLPEKTLHFITHVKCKDLYSPILMDVLKTMRLMLDKKLEKEVEVSHVQVMEQVRIHDHDHEHNRRHDQNPIPIMTINLDLSCPSPWSRTCAYHGHDLDPRIRCALRRGNTNPNANADMSVNNTPSKTSPKVMNDSSTRTEFLWTALESVNVDDPDEAESSSEDDDDEVDQAPEPVQQPPPYPRQQQVSSPPSTTSKTSKTKSKSALLREETKAAENVLFSR